MEKTYYKGKILDKTKLQSFLLDLGNLKNTSYSKTSDTFLKYLNTLEQNKKEDFIKKIKDIPSNNVTSLSNPQFSEIKLAINHMIDMLCNEENKKSPGKRFSEALLCLLHGRFPPFPPLLAVS